MRKIYTLFLSAFVLLGFNNNALSQGTDCTDPIVIGSLPYNTTDNTSNYGDNYSSADRPALGGEQVANGSGSGSYLNGDDAVYSFTPASTGCYNLTLNGIGTWVGFWLLEGCTPFTSIVGYHTSTTSDPRELLGVNLTAGVTYYIVISTWPTPQSTAYTLNVEECPSCPDPANLAVSNITTTEADFSWDAGGTETEWNIEWGTPGFVPGTGAEEGSLTQTTNNPETISGLASSANGTDYDIYVQAHCGAGDQSNWVGPISFSTLPTCPEPTNLAVSNISTTGADFSWDAGGTETAWNIEWGAPGFLPGTGAEDGLITGTNNNPETITGLNDASTYDIYVQADCGGGDESNWAGPFTFSTALIPVTNFPYSQDFESGEDGWILSNGSENNQWVVGTATSNGGSQALYVSDDGGTTHNYDVDVTSVVHAYKDFSVTAGAETVQLSFDWLGLGETVAWDRMRVYIVPTSFTPTAGTQISASGTAPTGNIQLGGEFNDQASYITEIFELDPAYIGQDFRLVFEWRNDGLFGSNNPAAVDNIYICTQLEDASFTVPSELCEVETSVIPSITGLAGGTFSGEAGLDIVDPSTGEIDPSNTPLGTYELYYETSAAACGNEDTVFVSVVDTEDASFNYPVTETCNDGDVEMPMVMGLQGGTFDAPSGLDLDASTGEVDPTASTPGVYTIEYTSSTSACASTETFDIEIIEVEDASFNYGGTEFCINYEEVVPTITGVQGGEFWGEPGIAINTVTGQVGAEASTPGTYWVYYTTPGTECPATDSVEITIDECLGLDENAMSSISVYPNPANEVVNYVLPEMTGEVSVTMMDATGKVVYENQVEGNAGSQEINVGKFENGMYMITFKNNDQISTKRIVISR